MSQMSCTILVILVMIDCICDTGDPLIYTAVCDFITHKQQVSNNLLVNLIPSPVPDYTGDCSASSSGGVGSSGLVSDVDGKTVGKAGEDG